MYWYTSSLGSVDARLRPFRSTCDNAFARLAQRQARSTYQDDVAYLGWFGQSGCFATTPWLIVRTAFGTECQESPRARRPATSLVSETQPHVPHDQQAAPLRSRRQ